EGEYVICRGSARPGRPGRAGRPEGLTRRRDLSLGAPRAYEVAAVGVRQAAAVLREHHAPLVLPRLALALVLGGYDDLPVALDLDTPHGPGALVESDLARTDPKAGIAPAGAAGGQVRVPLAVEARRNGRGDFAVPTIGRAGAICGIGGGIGMLRGAGRTTGRIALSGRCPGRGGRRCDASGIRVAPGQFARRVGPGSAGGCSEDGGDEYDVQGEAHESSPPGCGNTVAEDHAGRAPSGVTSGVTAKQERQCRSLVAFDCEGATGSTRHAARFRVGP